MYRNKKTGTEYVTCELDPFTGLALVTTKNCRAPYIVKMSNLEEL